MNRFLLRCRWLILVGGFLVWSPLFSQKLAIDAYYVRVITKEGSRFRGTLTDIDSSYLYLDNGSWIPLQTIRKVALRRQNKTVALLTGAVAGGLLTGYLGNQSLQTNQVRSIASYGLTLAFATVGGAVAGLLVGSAVHSITRKVIRPPNMPNADLYLARQLAPFSLRYQRNFLNRLPKSAQ